MKRRTFLNLDAGSALAATQPLAFSQTTKVRVGYLHTLAVDGQMWLADSMGLWKKKAWRWSSSSSRPGWSCSRP